MDKEKLQSILDNHKNWLGNDSDGKRADLTGAKLTGADLSGANLSEANLTEANLTEAYLSGAYLTRANLSGAYLSEANLTGAHLTKANLTGADLTGAKLTRAYLSEANLSRVEGLIKIIGVERGNYYWKAISDDLTNNGYQYKIGINELKTGEIFNADERILCSYPGFHFASKSWCKLNYSEREFLCRIKIPEDAQINEPWATDGKASADKIEIIAVYDMKTEKDITSQFK